MRRSYVAIGRDHPESAERFFARFREKAERLAPDLPVTIAAASQRSMSKNMPFEGWTLRGGVAATIVGGRLVYRNLAVAGVEAWPPASLQ